MSECKDHGADEAPWMCECTREKLAAMTAERDHNYGRLQAALSQLADAEVKRAEVVAERDGWKIACEAAQKVARDNEAELAEARRQIEALVNLYSDCGDCETCPVEIARCGHDQTRCIAAVKEWSLSEARKGRQEAQP